MTAEGDNSVLMQKVAKEHLSFMMKNPPKVETPSNTSVSEQSFLHYLLKVCKYIFDDCDTTPTLSLGS